MKPCPDYRETLWSDVYGELDPHERPAWERHMETCEACREERNQLVSLVETVRAAMPLPALSREQADALAGSVTRKIRNEREQMWWGGRLFGTPHRLIPALATTTLLIVVLSWFSLKEFKKPATVRITPDLAMKEHVMSEDLDVIRNLELLQEMEALEKLVKVPDKSEYSSPSHRRESKIDYGGAHV